MKKTFLLLCTAATIVSCNARPAPRELPEQVTLTKERLLDKIKGGWAGQTIGCTYGGPTEFKFNGTMIQEYTPIPWPEHYIKWWYENTPGLYDDVYMDLTFVEVFDRLGIDAPVDSLAAAFANAGYVLWHANQAARYNILNGIRPPESGHWINNPHADDLDFQIEADFAGLMSPGMPNAASEFCDRVGHIMNYGDGWYGGVYVAAMYSLSFVSDDIEILGDARQAFGCGLAFLLLLLPAMFICELYRRGENPASGIGTTIMGICYVALPLSLMCYIPIVGSDTWNPWIMVAYIFIIWANDVFAYLVGMSVGRHRLCERLSPKKSWEGFFGGIAGAVVLGLVAARVMDGSCWVWAGLALVAAATGVLGDLVESMFKRAAGVKDSGTLIPGHGGVLDRFDAMLLSAPFVFVYMLFVM